METGVDDRGQAVQIGAVVLFGFLVVAFSGYQAAIVPQQNAEVEFQHSQQVTEDLQGLRSDVVEAASTGQRHSQTVRLGTDYPPRIVALNPPPASGTIRTVTQGNGSYALAAPGVDLEDVCGYDRGDDDGGTVPSLGVEYEATYSEFREAPTVVYENSVAYRRFEGKNVTDTNQTLIDGSVITLYPLRGELSETGSETTTVDVVPGKAGVGRFDVNSSTSPVTLSVPSDLPAKEWERLLADEMENGHVTGVSEESGNVEISLGVGEYTVLCPVTGLGTAPTNTPAETLERSGDGGDNLNPGDSGEVRLTGIARVGGGDNGIVLTFTNPGESVNLSTARYNFYDAKKGAPETVDVYNYTDYPSGDPLVDDLQLRGATKYPDGVQRFSGDESTTKLALRFDDGGVDPAATDHAVLTLRFSDGQESLYFVDMPPESGPGAGTTTPTPGPGGEGSASNVAYVSGSETSWWGGDGVSFDVENTGTTDVTVEAITVSVSGGNPQQLAESNGGTNSRGQHEIYIDATDPGRLELASDVHSDGGDSYTLGTRADLTSVGSSEPATIGAGTEATVNMYQFQKNNGAAYDMDGVELTVTLHFADGTSDSYTFTP